MVVKTFALFVLIYKILFFFFYDVGRTDFGTENKEASANIDSGDFRDENETANMHDHGEDVEKSFSGYDFKSIDEDVVRQLIFQSVVDAEKIYISYADSTSLGIRK